MEKKGFDYDSIATLSASSVVSTRELETCMHLRVYVFLIRVVFHSNHDSSITGRRPLNHIHLKWVRIRRKNPYFVQHLQSSMKTFLFDGVVECIEITVTVSVSLGWNVEPTSTLYFRKWGFKQSLRKHRFLV